jgi:hypothetical protein
VAGAAASAAPHTPHVAAFLGEGEAQIGQILYVKYRFLTPVRLLTLWVKTHYTRRICLREGRSRGRKTNRELNRCSLFVR